MRVQHTHKGREIYTVVITCPKEISSPWELLVAHSRAGLQTLASVSTVEILCRGLPPPSQIYESRREREGSREGSREGEREGDRGRDGRIEGGKEGRGRREVVWEWRRGKR